MAPERANEIGIDDELSNLGMSQRFMAGIVVSFFVLAWLVDVWLGTFALVVFSVAVLLGPIAVLEGMRRLQARSSSPSR